MNHRESPQLPQGMRQAVPCLALLLVVATPGTLAAAGHQMAVVDVPMAEASGYLPVVGAPPLRFAEPPPPPDLTSHPTAGAPPLPSATETAAARAAAAAQSPASGDITLDTQLGAAETKAATPTAATATGDKPAAGPSSILPDEFRPQVRNEDFLPYFQIAAPGTHAGDVTVIAPVQTAAPSSSALPQSSATYIQTQK